MKLFFNQKGVLMKNNYTLLLCLTAAIAAPSYAAELTIGGETVEEGVKKVDFAKLKPQFIEMLGILDILKPVVEQTFASLETRNFEPLLNLLRTTSGQLDDQTAKALTLVSDNLNQFKGLLDVVIGRVGQMVDGLPAQFKPGVEAGLKGIKDIIKPDGLFETVVPKLLDLRSSLPKLQGNEEFLVDDLKKLAALPAYEPFKAVIAGLKLKVLDALNKIKKEITPGKIDQLTKGMEKGVAVFSKTKPVEAFSALDQPAKLSIMQAVGTARQSAPVILDVVSSLFEFVIEINRILKETGAAAKLPANVQEMLKLVEENTGTMAETMKSFNKALNKAVVGR